MRVTFFATVRSPARSAASPIRSRGMQATLADLVATLPENDCRYAVFDYHYTGKEGVLKTKIFFVAWCVCSSFFLGLGATIPVGLYACWAAHIIFRYRSGIHSALRDGRTAAPPAFVRFGKADLSRGVVADGFSPPQVA